MWALMRNVCVILRDALLLIELAASWVVIINTFFIGTIVVTFLYLIQLVHETCLSVCVPINLWNSFICDLTFSCPRNISVSWL